MNRRAAKLTIYVIAKALGLFWLARRMTPSRLRILAYHGFSIDDEAEFRDKLFINASTFERRLDLLIKSGYRVVPMEQALVDLERGNLSAACVAITIDDGYASTLSIAAPLLHARKIPALVYLTSYHMSKQTPVFDLVVGYLIWKTTKSHATLAWPSGNDLRQLNLTSTAARDLAGNELTALGHKLESEGDRVRLCRAIADALAVSYDDIVDRQAFRLMESEEVSRILNMGLTIGLHTHRHRFPIEDLDACRQELLENREYLENVVGVAAKHFCYPSGIYSSNQWMILNEIGVASATTCDVGLAVRTHSRFALPRFLDGESVDEIEFEAELSGFAELCRNAFRINRMAQKSE